MFEGSERVAPISYGAVEEALLRRTELKVLLWAFNLTVREGGGGDDRLACHQRDLLPLKETIVL